MSPAVAAPPPRPLSPAAREALIPSVTRLLEYLMHSGQPLAGVTAAYLAECAVIVGRVTIVILVFAPLD